MAKPMEHWSHLHRRKLLLRKSSQQRRGKEPAEPKKIVRPRVAADLTGLRRVMARVGKSIAVEVLTRKRRTRREASRGLHDAQKKAPRSIQALRDKDLGQIQRQNVRLAILILYDSSSKFSDLS